MRRDIFRDLYGSDAESGLMLEAGWPESVTQLGNGSIAVRLPMRKPGTGNDPALRLDLRIELLEGGLMRLRAGSQPIPDASGSPMIESLPATLPLDLAQVPEGGWVATDSSGVVRMQLLPPAPVRDKWSDLLPAPAPRLEFTLWPDGQTPVCLASHDHFFPAKVDGIAMGAAIDPAGTPTALGCGIAVEPGEALCGTGERFARLDLSGRTITLENEDAMGVNNTAAYKNVPWVLSSRGYGAFIHTSLPARLSLADHSSRSWQFAVPDESLDLFLIGGGDPETVLRNYRKLTGVPRPVPRWSYGIWMSRMTYFSAEEVESITRRLREEDWPCDVIHLDTGWFAKDWICEWEFGDSFPDPEGFLKRLREDGFRVSLWQNPNILRECRWVDELLEKGFLGKLPDKSGEQEDASDFSAREIVGQIDFSNPEATAWYREKIRRLLEMGAEAIKTDFGETINMETGYAGMSSRELRNLYGLLYQRAASDETLAVNGHGLVWARAGWTGCQRYPVHWGGDCACTWDGMAASLRGGLHIGLSGFGFWSHDVPGFHGLPDFMNSRPSPLLYLRWTQFGTFTSHFRYHGTSEREPWFYPEVAEAVKAWWRLRYALVPYLEQEGEALRLTGRPFLAALCFEDPSDPTNWRIDDQFMAGRDILVAPVMSDSGTRNVWLPAGEWVDLWTGEVHAGRQWLYAVTHAPETCPVYLRKGAEIPVYPGAIRHTGEMDPDKAVKLVVNDHYKGIRGSQLGGLFEILNS